MTLADYCKEANNSKITNAIYRSVKYPENFEVSNIAIENNWMIFDVYGTKAKTTAQVRIVS